MPLGMEVGLKRAARGSLEIQDAQNRQKSPSVHHRTTLWGYMFVNGAHVDNRKKSLLNSNISSTWPYNVVNLGPLTAEIGSVVWDTQANFNVTAATSLNVSQPNFARCLPSPGLVHYIYIFGGYCPVTEFCQVQNSLCVLHVLHSPILVALLHGTRAVGASQTLRRWAHGATCIQQGDHHVGHWPTFQFNK